MISMKILTNGWPAQKELPVSSCSTNRYREGRDDLYGEFRLANKPMQSFIKKTTGFPSTQDRVQLQDKGLQVPSRSSEDNQDQPISHKEDHWFQEGNDGGNHVETVAQQFRHLALNHVGLNHVDTVR